MSTDELKPCPFCGGNNLNSLMVGRPFEWQGEGPWSFKHAIECTDCGIQQRGYDRHSEAIAAWNTRTPSPADAELLEALEWYAERAAGCRKIGSAGDPARNALEHDGGRRAHTAIANATKGGEDGKA